MHFAQIYILNTFQVQTILNSSLGDNFILNKLCCFHEFQNTLIFSFKKRWIFQNERLYLKEMQYHKDTINISIKRHMGN